MTTAEMTYGHPGILAGPEEYRRLTEEHPWEQHPLHFNERWCPNCLISMARQNSRNGGVLCVIIAAADAPASHPGPQPCRGARPELENPRDGLYFLRDAKQRMLRVQRGIYYRMLRGF